MTWLFFTYWVNTDTSELQDASSSTVLKPKEGENAKTIMMKDQEVYYSIFTIYLYYHILNCNVYDYTLRMPKYGDESELDQLSSEKNKDTISSGIKISL